MAVYKCKICGGETTVDTNSGIATCEYCGTKQALPLFTEDSERLLYERGNNYLSHSEYDKAENVFNQLLAIKPSAAELYWDLVLCKYGVTYVKDPKTGKYIPTCNRTHFESVFQDENYKKAIDLATEEKKAYFEEVANTLDTIQKGILSIFKKEKPFDIFISYKETDANGKRTKDSIEAQKLYEKLTEAGYKVFFSRITLEKKAGTEYEPYIFAALQSAKAMLTISSSKENLEAPWVHNEWSRFLTLRQKDNTKTLIPLYFDMEKEALPQEFALLPSQDMLGEDFEQELLRGIKKLIPTPITKAEKRKKLLITLGSTFAACAAVAALLLFVIFPKLEGDRAREAEARQLLNLYTEAVAQFDLEDYEKALSSFRTLGDYKDAKEKVAILEKELVPYAKAQKLYEEGSMEDAATAFDALGDYKDSKARAQEIREKGIPYANAKKLYNDGYYPEAAWAFKAIADYKDASEWQKKAELSWRRSVATVVTYELDSAYYSFVDGFYYISANGQLEADSNCAGSAHTQFDSATVITNEKILSIYSHTASFLSAGNFSPSIQVLYGNGKVSSDADISNQIKNKLNADGTVTGTNWTNIVDLQSGYIAFYCGTSFVEGDFLLGVKSDGTLVMAGEAARYYKKAIETFSNVKQAKIDFDTGEFTVLTKEGKIRTLDFASKTITERKAENVFSLVGARYALKTNGEFICLEDGSVLLTDCVYGEDVVYGYLYESVRFYTYLVTKTGTIWIYEHGAGNVELYQEDAYKLSGKTKVHDEWILKMK